LSLCFFQFNVLLSKAISLKLIKKNFLNDFAGAWIFFTIFPKLPLILPRFKNITQYAPLLGIFIGYIQSLIFISLRNNSWPIFASASICIVSGFLITGGLHIDGLMDTFDGLYAGKDKFIKAMKDSRVGAFGVQAIILITLIQLASLMKIEDKIFHVLPICLFWGRVSTLIYIDKFKYFNYKRKSFSHQKYWRGLNKESRLSILILILLGLYNLTVSDSYIFIFKRLTLLVLGFILAWRIPILIGRKTGGVNGDTCGASVVLTETVMLFIYAIVL